VGGTMTKEEFNKLEVLDQLKYINSLLKEGQTLRKISSNLKMSKTTYRDRFAKIDYSYNAQLKQYSKDRSVDDQSRLKNNEVELITSNRVVEGNAEVIQDNNKSIKKTIIDKGNNNKTEQELKSALLEIRELLEMKDQLKEVIQQYNKDKKKINVQVQQELKVDKEKFNGELKTRLIKVYGNVNEAWIKFYKSNSQFKMQDLYSVALEEFIEKYSKR